MSGTIGKSRISRIPRGVWISAAAAVALLLAVSGRYGFHRDELYFVVAGRRLDWGFIDQPPLTPLVARVSESVLGLSPTALRVLPALAVGTVSVVSAVMARRFGAGWAGQVFAAFASGFTGVLLGVGHLLSTATFDYALWTLGLCFLVMILDGADPRWWLALGATVGVGMQNKYTIGFFAVAVLVALLSSDQRRLLASPLPWLGVAIAVVIALPNLIWQIASGLPQFEVAEALRARSDGPLAFVLTQPLLASPPLAIPAGAGLWWLARSDDARKWRPISIAYGLLFLGFLMTGGKAYYLAPMFPVLHAAGAVWFQRLSAGWRRSMMVVVAVGAVGSVLVALPVLPIERSGTFDATGEVGETVGWPLLVDEIKTVYESLPPGERVGVVIFTDSYGEAGAVDVLGPSRGLPAAASGHNNYWLWGPPDDHGSVIGVGSVAPLLESICPDLELVATLGNPYGVENEVVGKPLLLCRNPRGQLSDIWDEARHFN
jgi:4-amino-4-deoxy-L-arabinose transferase-like glycosyltransferase